MNRKDKKYDFKQVEMKMEVANSSEIMLSFNLFFKIYLFSVRKNFTQFIFNPNQPEAGFGFATLVYFAL